MLCSEISGGFRREIIEFDGGYAVVYARDDFFGDSGRAVSQPETEGEGDSPNVRKTTILTR